MDYGGDDDAEDGGDDEVCDVAGEGGEGDGGGPEDDFAGGGGEGWHGGVPPDDGDTYGGVRRFHRGKRGNGTLEAGRFPLGRESAGIVGQVKS